MKNINLKMNFSNSFIKRLISIVLSLLLIIGTFCQVDFSLLARSNKYVNSLQSGIEYEICYEKGYARITTYSGDSEEVVIPDVIEGFAVKEIGGFAFAWNDKLKSVSISDNVTTIGENAFYECSKLCYIKMSKNIEEVNYASFHNSKYYNDYTNWENDALYIGNLLYSVSSDYSGNFVVKDGTTAIASWCFFDLNEGKRAKNITSIILPDGILGIGHLAFSGCTGIKSMSIPSSIRYLGNAVFQNCTSLTLVNIDTVNLNSCGENIFQNSGIYNEKTNWENGLLYLNDILVDCSDDEEYIFVKPGTRIIADYVFGCKFNIKSVLLPTTVKHIGKLSFCDMQSLDEVSLPEGLEYIDDNAFDGCYLIEELTIPSTVKYVGKYAFNRMSELKKLTILNPECKIVDEYEEDNGGCYSIISSAVVYGYKGSTAQKFAIENGVSFESVGESAQAGACGASATYRYDKKSKTLYINGYGKMETPVPSSETGTFAKEHTPWYDYKDEIEQVVIADGITEISDYAFRYCKNLKKVNIPDSVIKIGTDAFMFCESLVLDSIGANVEVIGNQAFDRCLIKNLVIPASVKSIGLYAFAFIDSLETVTFLANVPNLGIGIFSDCKNLKTVILPENISNIANYMFANCTGLTDFTIPSSITTIGECAFGGCYSLKNINIPSSVTRIENSAFRECRSLFSIDIPDSVSFIGYEAFYQVDNINISNPSIATDAQAKFINGYINGDFVFEDSSMTKIVGFNHNCTKAVIPEGVTEIGAYAFQNATDLKEVSFPESLIKIGEYAFEMCSSIEKIELKNNIKRIERCAFYCCSNATYVDLGDSVEYIGQSAFFFCGALMNLKVPNSVKTVEECAFECVKNIVYNGSLDTSNWRAKAYNGYVEGYFVYADSTKTTLLGCSTQAQRVVVPDTVKTIGKAAFYECENLKKLILDDNLETIEQEAFTYCFNLESIYLPPSVKTIGNSVFSGCFNLNSIIIPEGVKEIGYNNINYISKVQLPKSLEYVNESFEGINDLYFQGTKEEFESKPYYKNIDWEWCPNLTIHYNEHLHNYKETELVVEDCENDGETKYTCVVCGDSYIKKYNKFGHLIVTDSEIPATCTKSGLTEGSHCSRCNKVIVAQKVMPIKGHNYSEKIINPTCISSGFTKYTCVDCGYSYVTSFIDAYGHSFGQTVIDPTCTQQGYTIYKCSMCDYTYNDDFVDPMGHSYKTVRVEPTCTVDGSITTTCERCGDSSSTKIDAIGHYYYIEEEDSTCTTRGYAKYICSNPGCEYSYIINYELKPDNHSGEEIWVTTKDYHYKKWTCCNKSSRQTKHNWNDLICADCGYACVHEGGISTCKTQGVCIHCGSSYGMYERSNHEGKPMLVTTPISHAWIYDCCGDVYIGESEHSFVNGVCSICSYICKHSWSAFGKGVDGVESRSCELCGLIDTRACDYVVKTVIPAECELVGIVNNICKTCGDSYLSEIKPLGHIEAIDEMVAPTCTQDGLTQGSHCTRCNKAVVAQKVIQALDHDYIKDVTNATCTDDGTVVTTCSRCEYWDIKVIKAKGHDNVLYRSSVTCTEAGNIVYKCNTCNKLSVEASDALGHEFVLADSIQNNEYSFECKYCHIQETKTPKEVFEMWSVDFLNTDIQRGSDNCYLDVVNDGVINAKDYALLLHM